MRTVHTSDLAPEVQYATSKSVHAYLYCEIRAPELQKLRISMWKRCVYSRLYVALDVEMGAPGSGASAFAQLFLVAFEGTF